MKRPIFLYRPEEVSLYGEASMYVVERTKATSAEGFIV